MGYDWQTELVPPEGTPVRYLGQRFDAEGRFLPEAGNTVVAQVVPGSPTEAALIWLRGEMMALPFAHHFAFTAIPSYHMTVFEGVIETRRKAGHWPESVPLDASIDDATAAMTGLLKGLEPLPDFAIRPVEVTPFGLTLEGATGGDEAKARAWRDRLSEALGYRTPHHDSYTFHTTLAYVRAWLPAAAIPDYEAAMRRLSDGFLARVPVMDLARPAFCRFADMNAFPPVALL
ncbi:DUF1868 domain-containing protein [Tabrizicola sp.]|uniref:DUF1868 domain-containing protein n=1 Tax=Tabrizicola sp. TaxID=2005166 RepID=UPI003F2C4A25